MNNIIDIRLTETGGELLTLTEVKTHLHITDTDNDTELTALITRCRKAVENYCNVSLVNKTVEMIADLCEEWELPHGPVIGIAGVQTATSQTGSAPTAYETQSSWSLSGLDFPKFAPSGACFSLSGLGRYKLTYTVGYQVLPADLKLALLNEILFRYENRGDTGESLCPESEYLASPYKRLAFL